MSEALNILNDFSPTPHGEWLEAVEKQLKGKPFDKALVKKSYEGIGIQPMYFKKDLEGLPQIDAMPGFGPYVRGCRVAGNRAASWRIAQEIAEALPEAFNDALKHDLGRGQNTIHIKLDEATMAGWDPDADDTPLEKVGSGGLSVATMGDFATVLGGIDSPMSFPVQIETGLSAGAVTALLAAYFTSEGDDLSKLEGCIALDPMASLLMDGALPMPLKKSLDEMADMTKWAIKNAPALRTIAIHGVHYANAGGSAVQEIAYAAATATFYIREMQKRGLAIDEIAPRMQFHLGIGSDFFMEIAKFRAARMVWQNIVQAFGGNGESQKMFIHAATLKYNKTRVDPWVNMLRVSTETFAGIAGSCDSIHVGPFDEVIRKPDAFSRRIARNVQMLLKEEAHFDKVADPAGGSWYVENITLELSKKIWETFQKVESEGGILEALKSGSPQEAVADIAAQRAKAIATRKDRIVGTNMYPNLTEKKLDIRPVDHAAIQKKRGEAMALFKEKNRDKADKRQDLLEALSTKKDAAVMDGLIEAAAAGATLGELTAALRKNGSDTQEAPLEITPLALHRRSEPYERLRGITEEYKEKSGNALKIFMANMGPLAKHKPRSDFSTAFFNVAAMDTVFNTGFATPDEAADAALASGEKAVVICGTDDDYMETVEPVTQKIKAADPGICVIVAGFSPKYVEQFKAAGVDEFIHLRADALAILGALQRHLMGDAYPDKTGNPADKGGAK